jgi:hypothetical protein
LEVLRLEKQVPELRWLGDHHARSARPPFRCVIHAAQNKFDHGRKTMEKYVVATKDSFTGLV